MLLLLLLRWHLHHWHGLRFEHVEDLGRHLLVAQDELVRVDLCAEQVELRRREDLTGRLLATATGATVAAVADDTCVSDSDIGAT